LHKDIKYNTSGKRDSERSGMRCCKGERMSGLILREGIKGEGEKDK
jgi:hypothetical protein